MTDPMSAAAAALGIEPGAPVNIGALCTDRHVARGDGERIALVHEDAAGVVRRFTYADLAALSTAFAVRLHDLGVRAPERVGFVLDRIPELYVGLLGGLKLGAVVQPLFSAFGEDALAVRLEDSAATVVVTQKKFLPRLRRTRAALPALRTIVVVDPDEGTLREGETALDLAAARGRPLAVLPTAAVSPSVLHYTSGTTGRPKGALHAHGTVVAQYATGRAVLDLGPGDVYWCTADPAWVTGTSYGIIAPWTIGATQVVFEGGFSAEAWYGVLERHGVTVWYTAPTALRMLMREDTAPLAGRDLSRVRHACSVGEPLNAEVVHWGRRALRMDIHDTYWQTETGAMIVANRPGLPIRPGSMGQPTPGARVALLDPETGSPVEDGRPGLLALDPAWPALMRHYWNNSDVFLRKFVAGWYVTGDMVRRDADGYFWFEGRDDDVINTAGHLVSPFEIESVLLEHPGVAESAAVGTPDPINHEVVKAFVVVKAGVEPTDDLRLDIMNFIRRRLSPLAMPQKIDFLERIPRTRSGKLVRRVLRAAEWGRAAGDLSTLDDE